jgi:penicillin amidase
VTGLSSRVEITRDSLGVPTLRGQTRVDVARATGFVHAQDRFFQMDLARRRAAGELAALVGPRALTADREIRIHRFRAEARRAIALLGPDDTSLLEAYAAGVNGGLEALGALPFEYLVLRQNPQPWTTEDSLLVVLSMFVTLQDTEGEYEATLATMRDVLPAPVYEFLVPKGSEWDTPLVGEPFAMAPIPGPEIYNPRATRAGRPPRPHTPPSRALSRRRDTADPWATRLDFLDEEAAAIGSNNFAVAGRLGTNGGALVANDMHLGIRVPNTWYRVALEWPADSSAAEPHRLVGVTLPGVPTLVAGSNTQVAWGFTNTYADWSDLVLLDVDPASPSRYRTPDGWRELERYDEVIAVAGQPADHLPVQWTMWGPVLEPDHRGRPRAYRWVAHSADRLAASITALESTRTVDEALATANGLGTPGQNIVVADRSGRIGWSVFGSIPRRIGLDGQLPASWADGTRRWDGWLAAAEYPRVVDPPGGRIWTANNRVVDGPMLAALGDGGYEIGSRARIIRDRLAARDQFAPRDLLAIQLDTSAEFLDRWRSLLLRTLTADRLAGHAERALFHGIVADEWSGRATPDSTAYRLTRTFRDIVSERVIQFVLADCYEADATFNYLTIRRRDASIWALVDQQPDHLLDPQYASWSDFLIAAIDSTIEQVMLGEEGNLRDRVWSEYNVSAFRHPLSAGLPFVGRLLDMPVVPLPGDLYTPRVHSGAIGASERMVVSPGREAEGIMHMPTGQSGHPLSPFYANSHAAWVDGAATPLLPGPTIHTLTLAP